MSVAITRGIEVRVESEYVPSRSVPVQNVFFFAYHITVTNHGETPAQLVARHWVITDGAGVQEHVRGPGVVGEQPRLLPGDSFRYTSFCPLTTEVGTMEGEYRMRYDDGTGFDARIAPFTLAAPHSLN